MAEIRVFHEDRFLCRAVCAELAGAAVPLRDILRARNQRRRELRGVLRDRQAAVDKLLQIKRGEATKKADASPAPADQATISQSPPALKRYRTNSGHPSVIVETLEHRRFAEFCDACRRYGYIGLCYGPPGVGKTLSARSYSRWDKVNQADRWGTGRGENPALDTVFYTPPVVNAPGKVDAEIKRWRDTLRDLTRQPLRLEREARLEALRRRDKEHLAKLLDEDRDWLTEPVPELHPTYGEMAKEYLVKDMQLRDPTTLILIDEADRHDEPRTGACHL